MEGLNPYGPYSFLSTVMNRGLYSQPEISRLASSEAENVQNSLRDISRQMISRSAASGSTMPWIMGGNMPGLGSQTLSGLRTAAGAKNRMIGENKSSQLSAAGNLGNLASILSGIEMTAERPTETPQYVTDAMGSYQQLMSTMMNLLGGGQFNWPTSNSVSGAGFASAA